MIHSPIASVIYQAAWYGTGIMIPIAASLLISRWFKRPSDGESNHLAVLIACPILIVLSIGSIVIPVMVQSFALDEVPDNDIAIAFQVISIAFALICNGILVFFYWSMLRSIIRLIRNQKLR